MFCRDELFAKTVKIHQQLIYFFTPKLEIVLSQNNALKSKLNVIRITLKNTKQVLHENALD